MTDSNQQSSTEIEQATNELREKLAGDNMPPAFAKLYSQHVRLRARQPGLKGWRTNESSLRLRDAIRILEAGFAERQSGSEKWRDLPRRTGELLEWLSHPELNPENLPTQLLAAAAYQISGYPARSTGLLNEGDSTSESAILRALLKADFVNLLALLAQHWQSVGSPETVPEFQWTQGGLPRAQYQKWVANKVASALGVVCSAVRWGDETRLASAKTLLSKVAGFMLYGVDTYSWLLSSLCSEVVDQYSKDTMRHHADGFFSRVDQEGRKALERYLRQGYLDCRTLAWPSQVRGIERILSQETFVLCTPTGSGKTTVAELAILESLFSSGTQSLSNETDLETAMPFVIYLVPTRALAAEVEAKLSRVLRWFENPIINVTSLYGGTDWGPTDAVLSSNERTVLICTYEKGEALTRFLGPSFWRRISLVIIDEAHAIQFDGTPGSLSQGENRSLRLESLSMRLLGNVEKVRAIALSAVAAGAENSLAQWISDRSDATPERTLYRSTRQLIGRLTCNPGRRFEIEYDLLDGSSLSFSESSRDSENTPFIREPFPPFPLLRQPWPDGPQKRLRPYLFWAAMQLAKPDDSGHQHSVLISVPQAIGGYAEDLLNLVETEWGGEKLPTFFVPPTDPARIGIWQTCLRSCADYFTPDSREYRLLAKGILVHHGKMPGLLSRLLITIIQERIVHLVLATSTLSEGVNLPFETILIPTLQRYPGHLSLREFANLVGRAGRPGYGTEGRTLVLVEPEREDTGSRDSWSVNQQRKTYFDLVDQLLKKTKAGPAVAQSPIARLLGELEAAWRRITQSALLEDFMNWLEQTAIGNESSNSTTQYPEMVADSLDTLDGILLACIVETEQLAGRDLSTDEIEVHLTRIWRRSYAYYTAASDAWFGEAFIRRGRSLHGRILADRSLRRRLYCTSLPPRSGNQLLQQYPELKDALKKGADYAVWNKEARIQYISEVMKGLSRVRKFRIDDELNGTVSRYDVLRWWLDPIGAEKKPTAKQISSWYDFVSNNFSYRFNWALGSLTALVFNDLHGGELVEMTMDSWPRTGLPWIVLWIKELITWGTSEPVAALLLARQLEQTRADAELVAQEYFQALSPSVNPDEVFNFPRMQEWILGRYGRSHSLAARPSSKMKARLLRDFSYQKQQEWRVIPIEKENAIQWYDVAGYPLAESEKPEGWLSSFLHSYDFILNSTNRIVSSSAYM